MIFLTTLLARLIQSIHPSNHHLCDRRHFLSCWPVLLQSPSRPPSLVFLPCARSAQPGLRSVPIAAAAAAEPPFMFMCACAYPFARRSFDNLFAEVLAWVLFARCRCSLRCYSRLSYRCAPPQLFHVHFEDDGLDRRSRHPLFPLRRRLSPFPFRPDVRPRL